jgi:hypothetical protein
MYLIISTLPHFYSIVPLLPYYSTHTYHYIHVIAASTLLSILYHLTGESNSIITTFDSCIACIWFLFDLHFGHTFRSSTIRSKILYINLTSFLLHACIPYNTTYIIYHSIWHILNASKSYYVSSLIADGIKNNS